MLGNLICGSRIFQSKTVVLFLLEDGDIHDAPQFRFCYLRIDLDLFEISNIKYNVRSNINKKLFSLRFGEETDQIRAFANN